MSWENYATNDTKQMIEAARKKKDKLDRLKRREKNSLLLFGISLASFICYILYYTDIASQNIFYAMVELISNAVNITIVSTIALLYFFYLEAKNKVKKEKDKYKELRGEIIKHLEKKWYVDDHSPMRDELSSFVKEKYDIDLRLKND